MTIKIKVQKDIFRTEVSVDPSASVAQVDELLKATKTNGKLVVLYNQGFVQGINVEQNSKVSDLASSEVRKILGIEDKSL